MVATNRQPAKPSLKLPPGPVPVKNILQLIPVMSEFRKGVISYMQAQLATYGEIYCLQMMGQIQYIITNPDTIHEVTVTQAAKFHKDHDYKDTKRGLARFVGNGLITSDGEFWKRQRRMVAPALHAKRIESYGQTMVDYTLALLDDWHDNTTIDMASEMTRLTVNIIAKTLFNADVSGDIERIRTAMTTLQHVAGEPSRLPGWIPLPKDLKSGRAVRLLDDIIYRIINDWRKIGEDGGDLLSMLLLARDDDGQPMTDREVRDEAMTLFLAGHETTANVLKWTWVLLAQHPEIAARLHQELDSVLGGKAPTPSDLGRLPYTQMVIKESMRLYPPVWAFGRTPIEDVQIGDYTFPKGSMVAIVTYFLHHDARWFPDPERFDPERFSPENEQKMPKFAYIPFGAGPRICIGNSFAMMEAQLILATIASRYSLGLHAGQTVEMLPLITLNPKGNLPMAIHERQPQPQMSAEPVLA